MIAALRSHTRIITEQQAAAIRGDALTFTKDYNQGNMAQSAMVRAGDAAGVPIVPRLLVRRAFRLRSCVLCGEAVEVLAQ